MERMRPVVGFNLHPRIPLEVDLFRKVNPSGKIPFEAVDPYRVEPAIVEPLSEDLYEGYAVPDRDGDDRFLEVLSRAPLGEGGLWDEHTANQYQLNDLTHDEPGGTEPQNEPTTDTENITSTRGKGTIMAGEATITVIGNLTSDPELRFTPSGSAVANFTTAAPGRRPARRMIPGPCRPTAVPLAGGATAPTPNLLSRRCNYRVSRYAGPDRHQEHHRKTKIVSKGHATMTHADDLRAWARGSCTAEAATELLLRAFGGKFAAPGNPWIHTSTGPEGPSQVRAWIDFAAIRGAGALSGGERRFLMPAASPVEDVPVVLGDVVPGLDRENLDLVLASIAHAGGSHEHSDVRFCEDGTASRGRGYFDLWPRALHAV